MTVVKFIEQLEDVFERSSGSIQAQDAFRDYDEWDSITLLTLIAMIEDDYGVTIPRVKFEAIETVQEMFDYVQENH